LHTQTLKDLAQTPQALKLYPMNANQASICLPQIINSWFFVEKMSRIVNQDTVDYIDSYTMPKAVFNWVLNL
jgi:hypothetical protein